MDMIAQKLADHKDRLLNILATKAQLEKDEIAVRGMIQALVELQTAEKK